MNGIAVRAFREKENLSAKELARMVGLHEQSLRNIENGGREPSDEVLGRLVRVLAVPRGAIVWDLEVAA